MAFKVLFVASELTPLAKVGGLGDVIGSLPKELGRQGVEVAVVIPRYEAISKKHLTRLGIFLLPIGKSLETVTLYQTKLPKSSVKVFCLDNERYLSRGPIYFDSSAFVGSFKEIQRFLFFSKAVYELLQEQVFKYDIIHCQDWHTGALAALLKNRGCRTVFTVHNLANQGRWPAAAVDRWFGAGVFEPMGKHYNFMAEGIRQADLVTTVSPTYAKEILTKEYGEGLEKLLRQRAGRGELVGILNGIDYDFWPRRSTASKAHHAAPVFSLVARLTKQKGIDLILPSIDRLVTRHNASFNFLGQGEIRLEKALRLAARKHPRNVKAVIGFDERLAHRWYAEADFFLMPSLFEPCGLGQMIAMRYGAIPIVRATGGLSDSVIDGRTGIVFRSASAAALAEALTRAAVLFEDKKRLAVMRGNCLKQDFSWRRAAGHYRTVYRRVAH